MSEPDNGTIRFTVKELLAKVDTKLDGISAMLGSKADGRDLIALEIRFTELKSQVDLQNKVNAALRTQTEETARKSAANFTRRDKIILAAVAVGALAIQIYAAIGG